ncbi:MAG TPA: C13 family peptidase [Burkholderiales bacterium]|nr:C13 family peptidase [Burkholderiales bacterium]
MNFGYQILANFGSGVRLALFLPVPAERIQATGLMLVALFATTVLLHFIRDFAAVGTGGTLMLFGLTGVLFYVPILLAAAVAIAWMAGRPHEALRLATAFAALSLPIIAVELSVLLFAVQSLMKLAPSSRVAWILWQWAVPAWLALASAVAALRLVGPMRGRAGAAALAVSLVVALSLALIYRERTLWAKPYDENATDAQRQFMAAATEDAIYQQPRLLARALDAIEPGRDGRIDLYYVGMGGYARQDVFMREVNAVEKMMQEQFGAGGRTASLLNNPKTVMEMPIASATSLKSVLKRMGEVMNRDEDILFLFMTSHGGKDHKFTLEFWPLTFNDLTPEVVRSALDDAGIQWRVIVVSACYAGGFINALRDERSIVVAAAGPDRKSFGCSNEAEWTYFGKAFFDEALRAEPRITAAFKSARAAVAAREKKERVEEQSDPQMHAGRGMERHWDAFLAQFDRSSTTASLGGGRVSTR